MANARGTRKHAILLNLLIILLRKILILYFANKCIGDKRVWLVILAFAAVVVTALWYSKAENDVYMLKLLSLILWGATIMVLVDHVMGYLMEGGAFLEITVEATILGIIMLIAALVVWEVALLLKDPKGILYKRVTLQTTLKPKP
jgi:hypothetical protein